MIAMLLACPVFLYALPSGESVVEGSATFDRSEANTLKINVASDKAVINYNSFSIAANENVYFSQPSVSAAALNRVTGSSISDISGLLSANGIIYLINPNGINIGPNANINAASFIASTLNIQNADFLAGRNKFFKDGENAFILNQGRIITNGGYVALLSQAVENQGTIIANLGSVVLASGEEMTLSLDDLSQLSVVITKEVQNSFGLGTDSAIKNSGTILANGGKVLLTAAILKDVFKYAINNMGIIEADSIIEHDGIIELVASGAPIINTGSLTAGNIKVSAPGTDYINIGKVIADGTVGLPNGGLVNIQAGSIQQSGLISANALENGKAGEIDIVSETSTLLDEGSSTEARALGLAGVGGRIIIDSTGGKTLVNKTAVIDVSGGAISGNAGSIDISAFDQLGFFGVLNGRAPPGYLPATVKFTYHSTAVSPVIIVTDLADYPPSGRPIISGTGFLPNQQITLNIFAPDGTQATLTATADATGSFTLLYTPDSLMQGAYFVTGTDGARSAVTTFTDAKIVTITLKDVSPTTINPGDTGNFTLTIEIPKGIYKNVGSITISLDEIDGSAWGIPTSVTVTGKSGWTYNTPTAGSIKLYATGSGSNNLQPGDTLTVTFSVTAPSSVSGMSKLRVTGYENQDYTGESNAKQKVISVGSVVIVDNTAPDTLIISGPPDWINNEKVTADFTWTGSDDVTPTSGLVYSYKVDSGAWSAYSGNTSASLTGLPEGVHTFYVAAKDAAGNVDSTPATYNFGVDNTPPVISASRTPDANINGWNNTDVVASYTASDSLSGLPLGTESGSHTFTAEAAGQSHTFTVTDLAGNSSSATIDNVNIDKTAPTLVFGSKSPIPTIYDWNNTDVNIGFTTGDALSGVASVSAASPLTFTAEAAGQTQSVTVTDKAGNSQTFTSPVVNIDKTAPIITASYSPTPTIYGWNNTAVTVSYTASDPVHNGVSSGIDSANAGNKLTPDSFLAVDGIYSGTATVFDKAGNSTTINPPVKIDTTPPTGTIVNLDPNVLWPPDHKIVNVLVTSNVNDPATNGAASGIDYLTLKITDEYNTYSATKTVTTASGFAVPLEASRYGNDFDGRTYTVAITGIVDKAGNSAPLPTNLFSLAVCPHDKVEVKILQAATTITSGVTNSGLSKKDDPNQYLNLKKNQPLITGTTTLLSPGKIK